MAEDPKSFLRSAIREGDVEALRTLITNTHDFADLINDVCTSHDLTSAILNKHVEVVKLLLENGFNVTNRYAERTFTVLHAAVHIGSEEIVKMLLNSNADPDAKDRFGHSPLHLAAKLGHLKISEILLDHGANINSLSHYESSDQYTPLYLAAEKNHVEVVELLLSKGANVNAGKGNDMTPVYVATEIGHDRVVKLLLEKGVDVDTKGNDNMTILNLAVKYNRSEIVEHIVRSNPNLDNTSNKKALNIAIKKAKERKIAEALLQYGFTVDHDDGIDIELLYAAVKNGFLTVVEDLLNYGANVNATCECPGFANSTLLHTAAQNSRDEVAKLLIKTGASINAVDEKKKTPIFYAIKNNNATITEILLMNRATVDNSMLNIAVMEGNREIVEMLLQKNISIHIRDDNCRTTLHYTGLVGGERWRCASSKDAAKERYKSDKAEIAELLISRGASVNLIDSVGQTTLHAAIKNNNMKIVELLLKYNCNINTEDRNGMTPLYDAIIRKNEAIVKMLLYRGADVNSLSREGFTALYFACEMGNEQIVEMLLNHGAKVGSTRRRMKNPFNIAVEKGYYEIVELLLKYGWDVNLGNSTALYTASLCGNIKIVRLLLAHGANITSENVTGLTMKIPMRYCNDSEYTNIDKKYPDRLEMAGHLTEHIVKMNLVGMHVEKDYSRLMMNIGNKYNCMKNDCEREIEAMKREKILNSNISLYDVFTKDITRITMYARNESIVEALETKKLEEKFPLYAQLISDHFKRGQWRNFLKSQCFKLMNTCLKYALPETVTDILFSYLSNAELMIFINACENKF